MIRMWGKIAITIAKWLAVVLAGGFCIGSCWLRLEALKRKSEARELHKRTKGLTNQKMDV